ncbi:MAG: hypothetical protein QM820_38065 [Minicystis sp.]
MRRNLEQDRLAEDARRAWLSATPPCLAPDLSRLEGGGYGVPFSSSSPEYDVAEGRLRASYATPELASTALLAWFGAGAGPWSGYPSYEEIARALLLRIGLPSACAAACVPGIEESALLGAARLLSGWEVVSGKKSELGDVPEALWARLRPIVRARGDDDNLSRFEDAASLAAEERRLRTRSSPIAAGAGLTVVGISPDGPLSGGLVSEDDILYTGVGGDIIMFQPTSTAPAVLLRGKDPVFELSPPGSGMLFVAHASAGTISKVLTSGSRLIVMARNQARPTDLVNSGTGVMAWLNQAEVPDPQRGAPHVVQRSLIMLFDDSTPEVLREPPESAFSLAADREHLYWCEVTAERLEIWRYAHARGTAPSCFARLGEHHAGSTWHPRLVVNATHVLWADPDRRAILGVDKKAGGQPVVLAETRYPPSLIAADDHDVFALTGDADARALHVEHAPARGGTASVVAAHERPSWDRPAVALTRRGLYLTWNDRVLMLARA